MVVRASGIRVTMKPINSNKINESVKIWKESTPRTSPVRKSPVKSPLRSLSFEEVCIENATRRVILDRLFN